MPASSSRRTSSGASEPVTDIRASVARVRSSSRCGGTDHRVLPGQPGPEQQRVVGAEGDRYTARQQVRQRHLLDGVVHAERDVGHRTHLQRHAGVDHSAEHVRVLNAADAVTQPMRPQRGEAAGDAVRTAQLARVRQAGEPGPASDREGGREVVGAAATLVVRQAETDDPPPGVLRGEPGERPGVQRVSGAVGGDDDGQRQPGRRPGGADRVQHQLGEGGETPEAGGVAGRVDLDLGPPTAVGDVVLGRLPDQPVHVVRRAEHGPGDVVEPLEPEPALLVGGRQHAAASPHAAPPAAGRRRGRRAPPASRAASTR